MKKQMFATCLVLCSFCLSSLQAQSLDTFQKMKKNGVYVEPITPFLEKKELRFGYERALNRKLSLNMGFGIGLKKEDPNYSDIATEKVVNSFTREGKSELTWVLFIPVWSSSYSAPLPAEESFEEESHFLRAHQFASAELKYFLITDQKNKLANGLYVAPGLTGGREVYSVYNYSAGTRNQIEVYDENSNTWGIPVLLGSSSDSWTERVTVFEYENRTRTTKVHSYLHPYLRAGYQLPIGSSFTVDLSARVLFKTGKEAFPEQTDFPFFFGNNGKKISQTSMALRVSYWF